MKHKGPQIHIDSCISDSPVFEHVQVRRYEAKTFGLQKLNLESSWNIFITQACSIELWKTRNVWSTLSTSSSLPVSRGGQPGASALSVRIRGGGISSRTQRWEDQSKYRFYRYHCWYWYQINTRINTFHQNSLLVFFIFWKGKISLKFAFLC